MNMYNNRINIHLTVHISSTFLLHKQLSAIAIEYDKPQVFKQI